ncbi:hypothetical protein OUZ56_033149 [Daphnia magna]|uniref:Uncharacterized protein n=1 Tax=Daphnia magna TaxID=35525 RepID=A0ABR0BAP2_9CRUS|nr:hypothetical protein OUZ56_033149 [Daphnia magna]
MSHGTSATSPALSTASRTVVALFHEELADVRFPDVDAPRVSAAYATVSEAHERVDAARRVLEAALAEEAVALEALERLSQRALGYLQDRPELAARVEEGLGRPKRVEPEVSRRGRPKKSGIAQLDIVPSDAHDVGADEPIAAE